jgi:hypothetical protein
MSTENIEKIAKRARKKCETEYTKSPAASGQGLEGIL